MKVVSGIAGLMGRRDKQLLRGWAPKHLLKAWCSGRDYSSTSQEKEQRQRFGCDEGCRGRLASQILQHTASRPSYCAQKKAFGKSVAALLEVLAVSKSVWPIGKLPTWLIHCFITSWRPNLQIDKAQIAGLYMQICSFALKQCRNALYEFCQTLQKIVKSKFSCSPLDSRHIQGARRAVDAVSGSLDNPLLVVPMAKASPHASGNAPPSNLHAQAAGPTESQNGGIDTDPSYRDLATSVTEENKAKLYVRLWAWEEVLNGRCTCVAFKPCFEGFRNKFGPMSHA